MLINKTFYYSLQYINIHSLPSTLIYEGCLFQCGRKESIAIAKIIHIMEPQELVNLIR